MSAERVQKILANAGIASRRKAEELISLGQVTINGKIAKLGDKAEWGKDSIKVNGKLITATEEPIYVAFNKPKNVISMIGDPQGRPHLGDYLGKIRGRIFPIGRLDFTSEGLLLLTNDGAIAEKIQKSTAIPRVYHVKVAGHPPAELIMRLASGVRTGDKYVKPHSINIHEDLSSKTRVEVVILGSGGDVRALFEMRGFRVDRIVRTAIGHITLHGLEPGSYRFLKKSQLESIIEQPEMAVLALAEEAKQRAEKAAAEKERELKRKAQGAVKILPKDQPLTKSPITPARYKKTAGKTAKSKAERSPKRSAKPGSGAKKPAKSRSKKPVSRVGTKRPKAKA